MDHHAAYIAIDWGTTNRRVHVMAADGAVLQTAQDSHGVLATARDGYPAEIATIRATYGALPVLAAGMIGSNRGWHDVAYVAAPAGVDEIAAGVLQLADAITIVPGVSSCDMGCADVMRGEEVQVMGAIVAGMAPHDALFCQPGTHTKWIATGHQKINRFTTAMTGELFGLLRGHGTLSGMIDGAVTDGRVFREGLARGAGRCDLMAALFQVRASVLLGTLAAEDAASMLSGILIGSDVGSREDIVGRDVYLLSTGAMAPLYATAIARSGGVPILLDSDAAFVAGIHALWEKLP